MTDEKKSTKSKSTKKSSKSKSSKKSTTKKKSTKSTKTSKPKQKAKKPKTKPKTPKKEDIDTKDIVDDSLLIQGVTFIEENKLDTALEAFEEFAEKYPKSHYGWYYIGYTQMLQDDKKKALRNFKKATKLNKKFLPSLYYQGLLEFENNEFQKALLIFDEIMEKFPTDEIKESQFNIPYFIAICHHYLGNLQRAEEYFLFAFNLSPTDPVVLYYKGFNELAMGNYEFAMETFKNLLAVDMNNQQFWNLFKGYSYYFQKHHDKEEEK